MNCKVELSFLGHAFTIYLDGNAFATMYVKFNYIARDIVGSYES